MFDLFDAEKVHKCISLSRSPDALQDGVIDVLEFWEMCVGLGKPIEIDMAAEALRKLDVNCDGVVDLQEFTTWWVPFEARMIERMRQEEEAAAQEEYVDEQAPQDDANESASRGSAPESPEALSASSPTSDNPNPNPNPDSEPASPDAPPAASPDALTQRPPSPLPQVDRSNIENQFAYIHRQSRLPPEFDEFRPQLSSASPSPSPSPLLASPIASAMSTSTRKYFQTKPLPPPPPAGSKRSAAQPRPSDSLALIMPALAARSDVQSTELWPPAAMPRASLAPCVVCHMSWVDFGCRMSGIVCRSWFFL